MSDTEKSMASVGAFIGAALVFTAFLTARLVKLTLNPVPETFWGDVRLLCEISLPIIFSTVAGLGIRRDKNRN